MELWAFGVSPHGLGLAPEVFWSLDAAEFGALKAVHDSAIRRWAMTIAADYNRTYDTHGVAWTANDFLEPNSRNARIAKHLVDQRAAMMLTVDLAKMKPGQRADDLPDWCK